MSRLRLLARLTMTLPILAALAAVVTPGDTASAAKPKKPLKGVSVEGPTRQIETATPDIPVGEWHRELGPISQCLTVTPGTFRACTAYNENDVGYLVELSADYSVNDEGLVYGVLTGFRIERHGDGETKLDDLIQISKLQETLLDQPFCLRWRVNGDGLLIKDVKFAGSGLEGEVEEFAELANFYAKGVFRTPKPTKGE
jgi:hypothetical protein